MICPISDNRTKGVIMLFTIFHFKESINVVRNSWLLLVWSFLHRRLTLDLAGIVSVTLNISFLYVSGNLEILHICHGTGTQAVTSAI